MLLKSLLLKTYLMTIEILPISLLVMMTSLWALMPDWAWRCQKGSITLKLTIAEEYARMLWYWGQQICLSAKCLQVAAKYSHWYHSHYRLVSQSHAHEISCDPEWQQQCDTWQMVKSEHLGTGAAAHSLQLRNQGRETVEGVHEALI